MTTLSALADYFLFSSFLLTESQRPPAKTSDVQTARRTENRKCSGFWMSRDTLPSWGSLEVVTPNPVIPLEVVTPNPVIPLEVVTPNLF